MASEKIQLSQNQTSRFLAMSFYVPFISPISCLYVFLVKTTDSFLFPHMRQGLTIFLLWFFTVFLLVFFPFVEWIAGPLLIVSSALGIYAAYDSRNYDIPFVSKIAKMLPLEKMYMKVTGKPFPISPTASVTPPTPVIPGPSVKN